MAAGAVANQDSMCAWLYLCADLRQMLVHRLGIGGRHSPTSRSGQIAPNIRPNRGDCPVPQVAVSQSAPTGRESTPSGPRWLRLGTTPPQACRPQPPAGLRSPGWRNFFESLLRCGIFLRAGRARLQPRQAKLAQQLGHAALVERDREVVGDLRAQINAAPTHNPVFLGIRALDYQLLQFP